VAIRGLTAFLFAGIMMTPSQIVSFLTKSIYFLSIKKLLFV